MRSSLHLCRYHDLSIPEVRYRVKLEADDPVKIESFDGFLLGSHSPIYSVSDAPIIPRERCSYHILFVVHHNPFVQIAKLSADTKQYLWYSLGITALIAILPDEMLLSTVRAELSSPEVRCLEIWHVDEDGALFSEIQITRPTEVSVAHTLPQTLPHSPHLLRILREMHLNFASLFKRARILMPSLIPTANRMVSAVRNEIQSMLDHESIRRDSVHAIGGDCRKASSLISQEYLVSHKQVNLSIDSLIQLNSALSYILSQSFYGAPPLAQNLSLNGSHSLLGVGTGIKAIQALIEFVSVGFSQYPIAIIVKSRYRDITIETFFANKDRTQLANRTCDHYADDLAPKIQSPKLAYFSTRMGFSEHGYCVTAASQCLAAADSSRRNLLTLTHELLHSHVKGLFSTILGSAVASPESSKLSLVQEYKKLGEQYRADPKCQAHWTVLEYLRYRIFLFCDGMHGIASRYPACRVDSNPIGIERVGPAADDHAEVGRFDSSFTFLNEVVVHVLDLHYFYDQSQRLYLATLWKSWATVPGVVDRIEWYILRSITAIAVINMHGLCQEDFSDLDDLLPSVGSDLDKRFKDAITTLEEVLEELCADEHNVPILHVVLATLQSPPTRDWLRLAFFRTHLFAQVVKQFLFSPRLRNYFDSFADPLADRNSSGDPEYRLETFEFSAQSITNPIALLRDRLLKELNGPNSEHEEARSAWLFMAIASVSVPQPTIDSP